MTAALDRTFSSLRIPNYRRYFAGQVVSISGNWMQIVAEMWLIVQLTGSGAAVGITAGLQFLPMLLFGAWGGLLADRLDKRTLLTVTQLCMALPAVALWGLTAGGAIETWMVFALVLVRGSVLAIDNPARQAFVMEMVGPDRVVNAVALNSVVVHTARILGPAAAGALIALVGVAACFAVNAATFAAMVVALRLMDPALLERTAVVPRARGQLRAALAYVRRTPALRIPLAMMVVAGVVSFNFQVLLPLLASQTWHGTAATYATLTAAMGVGSVLGALVAGARGTRDAAAARRLGGAVRRRGAAGCARAVVRAPGARAGAAGSGERHVRRGRQLLAAARGGADAARARAGALLDRLPRLDADRRAAGRLARRGRRPAQRPLRGRRRGVRGRGVRALGLTRARARNARSNPPGGPSWRRLAPRWTSPTLSPAACSRPAATSRSASSGAATSPSRRRSCGAAGASSLRATRAARPAWPTRTRA